MEYVCFDNYEWPRKYLNGELFWRDPFKARLHKGGAIDFSLSIFWNQDNDEMETKAAKLESQAYKDESAEKFNQVID